MKKLLVLLALCMVISVVLVACQEPDQPDTDSSDVTTDAPSEQPSETEPDPGTTDTEPNPGTTDTEPTPDTDTSDTESDTEPVVDPDPVSKHISFDELDMVLDGTETDIFAPGGSGNWDKIANVEDYHVQYLKVWGWLAWFNETPGVYGYSIDGGDVVYDDAFTVVVDPESEGGKPVYEAAITMGGKSVTRFAVMVPVRDLQGEHTITVYAKDVAGTEEVITEFTMNKAVDPAAPVFLYGANDLSPIVNGAPDIASGVVSDDGSYITITCSDTNNADGMDPWFTIRNINKNAQFVAVKYRTTFSGSNGNFFLASEGNDATGDGDMSTPHNYEGDGQWHIVVLDVSTVSKINAEYLISFLRFDVYGNCAEGETMDVAYIAGFNSIEAAEAYFAKTMIVADNTNTFVSDVDVNEVGTALGATDLSNFFTLNLPLPGSQIEELDGAKVYHMTSINEMVADVNGAYYVKANVLSANAAATVFVRGYQVVNSDAIIAAFDPAAGIFKINNYYETDGVNAYGGAGIYTTVMNGKLYILVKYYNAESTTRVGNATFTIPCEGTELTVADDGYTVSIMVNGVTYATIGLSGEQTYADINEVSPAGKFAANAVVTLKDGTTQTIENTLVAATANSQVGVASRAGSTKFSSIEVGGFTSIEVPALEIVLPEPVDPNAPIAVGDADYLAGAAMGPNNSHVESAVVSDDGAYVTITSGLGGDPNFYVLSSGSMMSGVQYVGIKYRTYIEGVRGELFVGSGSNPSGGADELYFDYIGDGEWHVLILDLTTHATVVDGLVNYMRYDFFTGGENQSIDVANIVLFGSLEAANAYYGIEEEPALGSEENPIFVEFNWNDTGADATVTVPAGATVYYQGYFYGMILSINGENMGVQYSENPRMPVVFSITNDGDADAEYAIVISYPAGTMDNPAQLVIGENTVTIEAGNTQGYFFTYTADAAGTLTITISCDAGWTYCINNLTTYVYGDIQWSDSDPVVNPAVITVAAGDVLQIMVNTYDAADMWNTPAGTVTVTATVDTAAVEETKTANVVIADYADANAWENGVLYSEILMNEDITVSVISTVSTGYAPNSGKYYTSGEGWRTYQTEAPVITIAAAEGKTIVSVKVTYESSKTGVLLNGDVQIESDVVVDVNANSIDFGVGNTNTDVSNGQVRITAIEVIYS